MLLTVEIIVAWSVAETVDGIDVIAKNRNALCAAVDETMGRRVDHASFPSVCQDGYTSYDVGGHIVQKWSLLLVGSQTKLSGKVDELRTLVDVVRPHAEAVRFKHEMT